MTWKLNRFLMFVVTLGLLAGCQSYEQHAADRTAQLRLLYPRGTPKQAVHDKWSGHQPDFSASRPTDGWNAYPNKYLAEALTTVETKTGKKIESVERFWGPDGFLSLARCWYYYDADDRIVDVEWEYMSD